MPFDIEATPKQIRAIRLLLRKYPSTVRPLLKGREIDSLNRRDASEIMSAIQEKHPRNGGGEAPGEPVAATWTTEAAGGAAASRRCWRSTTQRDQERRQRDEQMELEQERAARRGPEGPERNP